MAHPIECAPKENPFQVQYVRTGSVPAGDNVLLYDMGVTHVAVSGMQADNIVVGDIWVTYEVELSKPIISSNVTSAGYYAEYFNQSSPTSASLFGPATTLVNIGNLPLTVRDNTINIPPGTSGTLRFFIGLRGTLNTITLSGAPTVAGVTVTRLMALPGPSRFEPDNVTANAGATIVYAFEVIKTDVSANGTVTIGLFSQGAGTTLNSVSLLCYGTPNEV